MSGGVDRRRWWALAALVLSVLTIGFDITILNVALPTIATQLAVGTDTLQWIVNAYVLVLAGLLLPLGAIGDRYGRKRLMLLGLASFAAASLLATWAPSAGPVIAARAVMGVGAAILIPMTLAVLTVLFPPQERGKAVSLLVMGLGVGIPLGPILGGWLLDHFWWGSIFLINVPVALAAMAAIGLLLPESRDPTPPHPDVPGGLLSTLVLGSLVYGIIEAPARGWTDPLVLAALAAALVLLAGFVAWELRTPEPMIDLLLFRRPLFLWACMAITLASFALLGLLFVVPQYLQFVLGFDALGTGLRLLPMIAGTVVGAAAGARLAGRLGYRLPVAAGLLVIAGGLALGATTDLGSGYGLLAGWLALVGLGVGAALAPGTDAVLAVLPPERSGAGTALAYTLRQTGGALGVALLGSLLAQSYTDQVAVTGLPAPAAEIARDSIAGGLAVAAQLGDPALAVSAQAAYLHGMTLVLIACAAIAVLGAGLAAEFLPSRAAPHHDDRPTPRPGVTA